MTEAQGWECEEVSLGEKIVQTCRGAHASAGDVRPGVSGWAPGVCGGGRPGRGSEAEAEPP